MNHRIHIWKVNTVLPHLELSPPSKSRRVVLTLHALNAALEFSPHVVKGRHCYCVHTYILLTLILYNAQCARSPISRRPRNVAAANWTTKLNVTAARFRGNTVSVQYVATTRPHTRVCTYARVPAGNALSIYVRVRFTRTATILPAKWVSCHIYKETYAKDFA